MTLLELRYKLGEAVVVGKMSLGKVAAMYKASVNFVRKWARIFLARQTLMKNGWRIPV